MLFAARIGTVVRKLQCQEQALRPLCPHRVRRCAISRSAGSPSRQFCVASDLPSGSRRKQKLGLPRTPFCKTVPFCRLFQTRHRHQKVGV